MTSGLVEILIGNPNVQAIAGLESTKEAGIYKIFPVLAPQNEIEPFITIRMLGNTPTFSKDCFSTMDTPSYEVRCWAKRGLVMCEDVHEIVRRALETGTTVVTEACTFKKIWMTNEYDGYDEKSDMLCHIGIYSANVSRLPDLT